MHRVAGGGIFIDSTMPVTINNCHIHGNVATIRVVENRIGGGWKTISVPMCESDGSLGIEAKCADASWLARMGGGIFIRRGHVTITKSVIESNAVGSDLTASQSWRGSGGGIFIAGGDVTISDSSLSANTAEFGGAIADARALYGLWQGHQQFLRLAESETEQSLVVLRCQFLGNTAQTSAGAITLGCISAQQHSSGCRAAHARLIGNEIRGNQAGVSGGAMMLYQVETGAFLQSNTFEGNAAPVESVFKVNQEVAGEAYNTTFINNQYASLAPANDGEEVAAAGTMVNVRSVDFTFRCALGGYMDATPFVMAPQDLEGCKRCPRGVYGDSPTLRAPECSGACPPGHYCNAERL